MTLASQRARSPNVIARAALGLAVMMLAVAPLILLPAGTARYWQACTYLAVFGASTLGITAYLVRYDRALLGRETS